MSTRFAPLLAVLVATAAPVPRSSPDQQDSAWIEYAVSGDFTVQARDVDALICSVDEEEWLLLIAARGAWYFDLEIEGLEAGQYEGSFQLTLPATLEGAPSNAIARRMRGYGVFTVRDAPSTGGAFRTIEVDFQADELRNREDQAITVEGSLSCPVL